MNSNEIDFSHKKIKLSDDCLDLMKSLLTKDPKKRINWDDFFCHKWFLNDEILKQENNLLEISFGGSMPSLSNIKNDKQFCSFTYESIVQNKNLSSSERESSEYNKRSIINSEVENKNLEKKILKNLKIKILKNLKIKILKKLKIKIKKKTKK